MLKLRFKNWYYPCFLVTLLTGLSFLFPYSIPDYPTSTILNSREGTLLSASIAEDGQWRFPLTDSVPTKLATCLLQFEDEYFHYHPGVNLVSLFRASWQNISSKKVVSGASTITMQLARMLRKQRRNLWQKGIEMMIALRIELHYSKEEILRYYASLAPFGGNVVGIDAASWRYFGRSAHLLSWAESATLAVLPNDPGSIYPGKEMVALEKKRNFVLKKLLIHGVIDSLTYTLSITEPLPERPYNIPQKAHHLLTTLLPSHKGQQIRALLNAEWQTETLRITGRHHEQLKQNGIDNLAAMVVDLHTGEVLSYVGNTSDPAADGHYVDVIQSPRSSGSILKPILYTTALDQGQILPSSLLDDVPSFFGGYSPKNFNLGYMGMVPADQALSKSLNIPFVHLLKAYSYEQFHHDLQSMGITTLEDSPGRYGLSLILGGSEVKLWDLAQVYFSMYRKLTLDDNRSISVTAAPDPLPDLSMEEINIWHAFKAMTNLQRVYDHSNWENFSSTQRIAWKTGTSFGFRDAWAVGLNGSVLVAVWVGNADGEGRSGLIGATTAGPILNDLMRFSAYHPGWLEKWKPMGTDQQVCTKSGRLASGSCPEVATITCGRNSEKSGLCQYHKKLWVDDSERYLVNRSCYKSELAKEKVFFTLPPKQGFYYRKNHSNYLGKPKPLPGCQIIKDDLLTISYPTKNARIFIPKEIDGEYGQVIMEAAHQSSKAKLFWHLNDEYLGETKNNHRMAVSLGKGVYELSVVDEDGNSNSNRFEIISDISE